MSDKTYILWHKDGIGGLDSMSEYKVRVYKNGKLANTKGKHENIVITVEKKCKK